ncbi:DUF6245 family protein, partial [Frankia sp. ACN1ag]|uniref:DUF6245 family protein n=1 Tax=Frankia sp. ACN1ag TaxID=102891 RepID=UPI001F1DB303
AAMAALGLYDGANTPAEHAAEAARLGGVEAYRLRMVNALLGMAQAEAVLAEGAVDDAAARHAAWEQQLVSAGVADDAVRRIGFVRWQVLRLIAQHPETGPIPVAAAHAVTGLHTLLGVIAASQGAVATGDVATLAGQSEQLRDARQALTDAVGNVDILLDMLRSVGL